MKSINNVNVPTVISDLFFMVDNSQYWQLLEACEEDAVEVLNQNAEDFCYLIGNMGYDIDKDDLIEDFLSRV